MPLISLNYFIHTVEDESDASLDIIEIHFEPPSFRVNLGNVAIL